MTSPRLLSSTWCPQDVSSEISFTCMADTRASAPRLEASRQLDTCHPGPLSSLVGAPSAHEHPVLHGDCPRPATVAVGSAGGGAHEKRRRGAGEAGCRGATGAYRVVQQRRVLALGGAVAAVVAQRGLTQLQRLVRHFLQRPHRVCRQRQTPHRREQPGRLAPSPNALPRRQ